MVTRGGAIVLLVTLLVAVTAIGPTVAVADSESAGKTAHIETRAASAASTTTDGNIHQRTTLSLTPSQSGEIAATTRYELPDAVRSIEVTLPAEATVRQASGFRRVDDRTFEWDGRTDTPELAYDFAVNRSVEGARSPAELKTTSSGSRARAIAADGRIQTAEGDYSFVDVGSWAIAPVPSMGVSWSYSGANVALRKSTVVDGEGATGGEIAYLGPYEEHVRQAHSQRFRLIVPEAATLEESPERILDSLEQASGRLAVGERDPEVFFVAAPGGVDWGPLGLESGGSDAWIRADARVDTPTNVWLHEYVHTRQGYQPTDGTRWTEEGGADYYAALLTLEQGRISFDAVRDRLARGATGEASTAVLSDPSTWARGANYLKGALVWGVIDFQIRRADDRSADAVLARMNSRDDPITESIFLDAVATTGGSDVRETARRYTRTSDAPEPWSRTEHSTVFSGPNVRVLLDAAAYRVSGPYRDRTLSPNRTLVRNETLTVSVPATNVGDEPATAEIAIQHDGTTVASESVQIDAGDERTLTVRTALDQTGTYTLQTDSGTVPISVQEPAPVRVRGVSVEPQSIAPGDPATVTVDVANDADRPAGGTIELRAKGSDGEQTDGERTDGKQIDGDVLARERVRLDVDASETLSITVRFDAPGAYSLRVGQAATTLDVRAGSTPTSTTADGALPVPVAVVAVVLTFALVRWLDVRQ